MKLHILTGPERGLSGPQQREGKDVARFLGAVECSRGAADWKVRAPSCLNPPPRMKNGAFYLDSDGETGD